MSEHLQVTCPCCETILDVDVETGAVISHQEKAKPLSSFEDLKDEMTRKSELRDQLFAQEQKTQKDRSRILEEKFQEALKKAEGAPDEPFKNPLDMD
ncbi:MAG: hypothetical protein R2684_10445 [Pyrinomonadaceae bacterium]